MVWMPDRSTAWSGVHDYDSIAFLLWKGAVPDEKNFSSLPLANRVSQCYLMS